MWRDFNGRTAVELSFRRIVFQRCDFPGKSREPGRKYRRVIAYGRAIIRAARVRTPRLYYLEPVQRWMMMKRKGRGGDGGKRSAFKIEQFLIMPALLVIRDTGVPAADGTSLLLYPKRGGGR